MILVGLGLTLMHGIEVSDSWTTLLAGSIVAGIGIGMTNPGIASVAIGVVDAARAGMASGINSTFRQVGIATGTAALGAIFQSRIDVEAQRAAARTRRTTFSEAVASGATQTAIASVPPPLRERAAEAANQAFVSGLNEILLVGAAIAFAGGIASWLLVRRRDLVAPPVADGRRRRASPSPEPVS